MTPPQRSTDWRRHALLAIAIVLMVAGAVVGLTPANSSRAFAQGVFLKTGMVTFMWWLALPQLQKLNPWATGAVLTCGLIAIVRPQLFLVAARVAIPLLPLLCVIWLLRRPKK